MHACGSCSKDIAFMMCSWHSIKRTETRGVKMFSANTNRDVGMVPLIKFVRLANYDLVVRL